MTFVFFSSSELAGVFLEEMKRAGLVPSLIITIPDKPVGRGLKPKPPEAKKWAEENSVPYLQPEKPDDSLANKLKTANYKLFVIAFYGKILPKAIFEIPKRGTLNVHPSLLPRWRGADPIRAAILAGDSETGVSVILIDEKADHGPILAQEELKHQINNTQYSILKSELAELGSKLLVEIIPKWLSGEITPKEQNHKLATYTKKISKEDGHIDWNESAEIILRKIRAFNPWPGTFAFWKKNGEKLRIKIMSARLADHTPCGLEEKRGVVIKYEIGIAVSSGDQFIAVEKIQLEGKKPQNAKDFLNGHPDIIGAVLN